MKINIKMKVTPKQRKKVVTLITNRYFEYHVDGVALWIFVDQERLASDTEFEEVDADLFIRTNGTCEEPNAKHGSFDEAIKVFAKVSSDLASSVAILHKAFTELKPQRRTVTMPDGTVLPEPVREPLKIGDKYYVANVFNEDVLGPMDWTGNFHELRWLINSLIHLEEENAKSWTEYILSLTQRS